MIEERGVVADIPLKLIYSIGNVREADQELVASMRENGLKVPIQVYPDSQGKYIIKYGHRRFNGAQVLGWPTIRCVIETPPADEADMLVSQTIENEQRQGMSYLDKARVYARLKELGWTQRQIAQRFSKSDADVSLALSMLRADPKLQKAVEDGLIKPSAVEPMLSLSPDEQAELADAAIKEKTVRKVAKLVDAHKKKKETFKQQARESDIPDEADPMEVLALEELAEAVEHLEFVQQTPIQHPKLQRQARPTVEKLLRQAASLRQYLGHETWDDLADLI